MSDAERRLTRLTTQLTATQAWLLWREEAYAHGSMNNYVLSLEGQPDDVYPLFRLPRQMEEAVGQAMKGEKDHRRIDRAVRQAQKDVAFLHYLHSQFTSRFHTEKRALFLQLLVIIYQLRAWMRDDDPFATLGEGWDHTAGYVIEVYSYQLAHDALRQQYFEGHSPLFPDLEEALANLVQGLEWAMGMYNDHCLWLEHLQNKRKRRGSTPMEPFDLEDLRRQAAPAAERLASVTVALARAEACMLMGETKQAYRYVEPHVWGR